MRIPLVLVALAAALAAPPAAAEAVSLTQLPGAAACVREGGAGGCTRTRETDFAETVAVAPDGRFAYVAGGLDVHGALTTFARDPETGALTQLAAPAGCIETNGDTEQAAPVSAGCVRGRSMPSLDEVEISPDGATLYAAVGNEPDYRQAIAVFRRDPATGELAQLQCVTIRPAEGCLQGTFLEIGDIVLSRDGRTLIAGGSALSALPIAGDGTIASAGRCSVVLGPNSSPDGLCRARRDRRRLPIKELAMTADGRRLYAGAGDEDFVGSQVQAYELDSVDAAAPPRLAACTGAPGCRRARALDEVHDIALTPDGRTLYTASSRFDVTDDIGLDGYIGNSGLGVYAAPGLAQLPGRRGCIEAGVERGRLPKSCAHGREVLGATAVEATPDGRHVLAGFEASHKVVLYRRNPTTQGLRRVAGAGGCVEQRPRSTSLCSEGRGLSGITDITISPDGGNAYVATETGVAVLRIR